ncbi:MAG: DUF6273 domain-containing protein [Oscillospiraceae bacterium]|nr:DUF6273 domain-containing protein [Oscillospiraceae bacterium]
MPKSKAEIITNLENITASDNGIEAMIKPFVEKQFHLSEQINMALNFTLSGLNVFQDKLGEFAEDLQHSGERHLAQKLKNESISLRQIIDRIQGGGYGAASEFESRFLNESGELRKVRERLLKCLDELKVPTKAKFAKKNASQEPIQRNIPAGATVESLMKRGWLFIEDGDWGKADEYFDYVLDLNPEYGAAYFGKLCSELRVASEAGLIETCLNRNVSLDHFSNYKKTLRFSSEKSRLQLEGYNQTIEKHIMERVKRKADAEFAEKEREKNDVRYVVESIRKYQRILNEANIKLNESIEQNVCYYCGGKIGFWRKCKDCKKPVEFSISVISESPIIGPFGEYYWKILDIDNDKALMITEKAVEHREYNEKEGYSVTWENCTLRKYLNGEFYQRFTEFEQSFIIEVDNENQTNRWYDKDYSCVNTRDKVFLLSLEEADRFFGNSGDYLGKRSKRGEFLSNRHDILRKLNSGWWWLRTGAPYITGGFNGYPGVACVTGSGAINVGGYRVNNESFVGVRPAVFLKLYER